MPSVTAQNRGFAPFIVSTSLAQPDPNTRKLIRSHVMRGKNAGKVRRKPAQVQPTCKPAATGTRESPSKKQLRPKPHSAESGVEVEEWLVVPLRKVASNFSLYGFESDTEPYMLDLLYRAFTVVKPATYTLQDLTSHAPEDQLFCFGNLTHYPGILHSMIFAAQAFHDLSVGPSYGTVARLHFAKAIHHLQLSLDNAEEAVEHSTMAVVTSLAVGALIVADLEAAGKHMDGLRRIVDLRGGLQSLGQGSILDKARAIDFGLAIGLGNDLRFSTSNTDDISWSPHLARGRSATRFPELSAAMKLHGRLDPRLLNIWADLREFSRLANKVAVTGVRIPIEVTSRVAASAPHRLVCLRADGADPGSLQELLRVCMLGYVKVLLIKVRGIGRKMTFLADGLRGALLAWRRCVSVLLPRGVAEQAGVLRLILWGLFVASVSVFEECEEGWLGEMLAQVVAVLGLSSWDETRAVLRGFLWIDVVLDKPGEQVFEQCCKGARSGYSETS